MKTEDYPFTFKLHVHVVFMDVNKDRKHHIYFDTWFIITQDLSGDNIVLLELQIKYICVLV